MLCKLYLEHYDIGGPEESTLEPVTFSDLDDYIYSFEFVRVMSPSEYDLFAEGDWFEDSPYWEEFVEDLKKCTSIIVYGESGGTSYDSIVQFIF